MVSRRVHSKDDKETIVSWKSDFDKILRVFDVRSVIRIKAGADFPLPEGTTSAKRGLMYMRLLAPKSKSDRTVAHTFASDLDALVAPVRGAWKRIYISLGGGAKKIAGAIGYH